MNIETHPESDPAADCYHGASLAHKADEEARNTAIRAAHEEAIAKEAAARAELAATAANTKTRHDALRIQVAIDAYDPNKPLSGDNRFPCVPGSPAVAEEGAPFYVEHAITRDVGHSISSTGMAVMRWVCEACGYQGHSPLS